MPEDDPMAQHANEVAQNIFIDADRKIKQFEYEKRVKDDKPPFCVNCVHHEQRDLEGEECLGGIKCSGVHVCNVNVACTSNVVTGVIEKNGFLNCEMMREHNNSQCGYYGKLFVPIKK